MKMPVEFEPFGLPNFLRVTALGSTAQFPVGDMDEEAAAAYWDWMREKWLAHVRAKRSARKPEEPRPERGGGDRGDR